MGVCELLSVGEPSRNKKRRAMPAKTEGRNDVQLLKDAAPDTEEYLPITDKRKMTKTHNSQPPGCHLLSSLLDHHAFNPCALGLYVWLCASATGIAADHESHTPNTTLS